MWNILLGIAFIIGGASGGCVLRGTESCAALIVVGVILVIIGVFQVAGGSGKPQQKQ